MKSLTGFAFGLPWWAGLLLAIAVLVAVSELGFWIGRWRAGREGPPASSEVGRLVAALVTLLSLLLGFSLNMVDGRLRERKALIIDEANAIGTAYRRAALIGEPQATRARAELRRYVELRLEPKTIEALERAIRASEATHQRLWNLLEAAVEANPPDSQAVARFEVAVDEVINLHYKRITVGYYGGLPRMITAVVWLASVLALLMVGFWSGLLSRRLPLAVLALVVAVSFPIVTIHRLSAARTGLLDHTQRVMKDLEASLNRGA